MRLLIFETETRGHPPHYVSVLARHAATRFPGHTIIFAIAAETFRRLPADVLEILQAGSSLRARILGQDELTNANQPTPIWLRSVTRWRLVMKLVREFSADAVLFLGLDEVLFSMAVEPQTTLCLTGILFRASTHFPEYRKGLRGSLRQFAKSFLMRRALNRRDLMAVLSLDPTLGAYAARWYRGGEKVVALPESVINPRGQQLARDPSHPVRFLLFGALEARKGVFQLLDAVELLAPENSALYEVVLCGDGGASDAIAAKIESLRAAGRPASFQRGYLTDSNLEEALIRSDVILAPYIDHIGSSSVLHIAASLRKPVLGPSSGLLGRQIVAYNLGRAVDTRQPAEIARAMHQFVAEISDGLGVRRCYDEFTEGQGAEFFAACALGHALGILKAG